MSKSASVWHIRSLASLGTYLNGFAFKPQHWGEAGLPIVRIRELLDPTVEPDHYQGPVAHSFRIDDDDLIFSWSATLVALFWNCGPAYLNQHLFKVTAAHDVDVRFLHCLINFHLDRLSARSHGTTMKHITRSDLEDYLIELPAFGEQRRIAEILDTLDDQIRATGQIIGKYVAQKHGLVDDIVSRAVHRAVDGDRACIFAHLGSIVQEYGGVIQTGPFGSQLHAYDYVGEGVPVVMPQDIVDGRIALDSIAQVPERMARSLARHRMELGDVVFARRGDLERCAEITHREQAWLCGTGCLLVRTAPSVLSAGWLALVYRHEFGQRHVRAHAVGSTMANLNRAILAGLRIPLPPVAEQQEAVSTVAAQDEQIELERRRLAKLRSMKSGLMTNLLTGRTRVSEEFAS